MMTAIHWRIAAALSLAMIVGCSGENLPERAPVSGTVLFQGQPVQGANVTFTNADSPRAATGTTDAQGKFQLTTFDTNDGAVLGEHVVTIVKPTPSPAAGNMSASDPGADYAKAMAGAAQSAGKVDTELPAKYASVQTSDLKHTVTKEGPNEFTFDLK